MLSYEQGKILETFNLQTDMILLTLCVWLLFLNYSERPCIL